MKRHGWVIRMQATETESRPNSFATSESRVRRGDCPACGARLVITPRGTYGPCEGAFPFLPGWFFSEPAQVQGLSSKLAAWPGNHVECATCEASGLCGGGCVLDAYLENGCLSGPDRRTCHLSRAIFHFALEELAAQIPRYQAGRVISITEKQRAFQGFLSAGSRPLQSSSRFGEAGVL